MNPTDNITNSSKSNYLSRLIKSVDCLFTPLLGDIESTDFPYSANYLDKPLDTWNTPGSGYLNRAWCRVEMFYASNLTNYPDSKSRIDKLKSGLHHYSSVGKRPHFVYGLHQEIHNEIPVLLSPLSNNMLETLSPEAGHCSQDDDKLKVMELMKNLQEDIKRNGEGYFGDVKNKKMHGKGLLRFSSGAFYHGDFRVGKKHGIGTFVFASGNVYSGEW